MERSEFINEVNKWAKKIGVEPKEIQIRLMKRKWGSCSLGGRVTFNAELLNQSDDKRKEVIVHELLHLKYNGHNKLFKNLVLSYLSED